MWKCWKNLKNNWIFIYPRPSNLKSLITTVPEIEPVLTWTHILCTRIEILMTLINCIRYKTLAAVVQASRCQSYKLRFQVGSPFGVNICMNNNYVVESWVFNIYLSMFILCSVAVTQALHTLTLGQLVSSVPRYLFIIIVSLLFYRYTDRYLLRSQKQ